MTLLIGYARSSSWLFVVLIGARPAYAWLLSIHFRTFVDITRNLICCLREILGLLVLSKQVCWGISPLPAQRPTCASPKPWSRHADDSSRRCGQCPSVSRCGGQGRQVAIMSLCSVVIIYHEFQSSGSH
ncbi:hypothetical protein QBC42DRAFT_12463 [Cladorrhinum samala]|uniref:Secreted protein n=1 Tax=Cladorrhinum samala TaxID=585594 RepID=A0AAV9HEK7_9PEZI|nr:hypothetical protein QBC42DRAFT_12463 [Cladorrhinum samala]